MNPRGFYSASGGAPGHRAVIAPRAPHAGEIDARQEHDQVRGADLDVLGPVGRGGEAIAPLLEPLEVAITMPSLLCRYTNCLRPDRHSSRVARLSRYRAGRLLGMTKAGCRAAIQELFPFASCRSRRTSSLSAQTIRCFPEGVRREWTQPCFTQ